MMTNQAAVDKIWNDNNAFQDFLTYSRTDTQPPITPLERQRAALATVRSVQRPILAPTFPEPNERPDFTQFWDRVNSNPCCPMRTRLISGYFVHGRADLYTPDVTWNPNPEFINCSAEDVERFVAQCVHDAKTLGRARKSENVPQDIPAYDLVFGERGVGKSFFQSYIASNFVHDFDRERVVWVRISLVRPWTDPGMGHEHVNLENWINAQAAKILCRYYDNASKRCPAWRDEALLTDYADVLRKKNKLTPAAKTMLDRFRLADGVEDHFLSPDWIDRGALDTIINTAYERGFSFIVVIDGMDLLDHSEIHARRFRMLCEATARYLIQNEVQWKHHLVFLRNESLGVFQRHVNRCVAGIRYDRRQYRSYTLAPVDLIDVYESRVRTLRSPDVERFFRRPPKGALDKLDEYIRMRESNMFDACDNPLSHLQAVKDTQGSNTRAAMQVLHLALYRFQSEDEYRGEGLPPRYWLTQAQMVGRDDRYPPAICKYRRSWRKPGQDALALRYTFEKLEGAGTWVAYDCNFLPSIFQCPFDSRDTSTNVYGEAPWQPMLLGLRALQLLPTLDSVSKTLGNSELRTIRALVLTLNDLFGYQQEVAITTVLEFIDSELIAYRMQAMERESDPYGRAICVTAKGRAMLDYYLFDPTYLSIASYNVAMPISFLSAAQEHFSAVPIAMGARSGETRDYVISKLRNSCSMARLIFGFNAAQERHSLRYDDYKQPHSKIVLGMARQSVTTTHQGLFSFATQMQVRLGAVWGRIIGSLIPESYADVSDLLQVGGWTP